MLIERGAIVSVVVIPFWMVRIWRARHQQVARRNHGADRILERTGRFLIRRPAGIDGAVYQSEVTIVGQHVGRQPVAPSRCDLERPLCQ